MKHRAKKHTFAERFLALKGDDSYVALYEKLAKRGIEVSPAALHKWGNGGGITSDNLEVLAGYFGVSPAELFFGEIPPTPAGRTQVSIYKRGNVWWCAFTSPGGVSIRESTGTREKKQAQEYHDARKSDLWRQSKLGEKPDRLWEEAATRWLVEKQHKKSLATDAMRIEWFHTHFSARG